MTPVRNRRTMSAGNAHKPGLLYVSQVTPALAGVGAALRTGAILAALAVHYRVTLLLAPHAGESVQPLAPELAATLERIVWPRSGSPLFSEERFDVVHIAGLESAPAAAPWLATAGLRQLDLGPLLSRRARSLARLARTKGHLDEANRWLEREAQARQADGHIGVGPGNAFAETLHLGQWARLLRYQQRHGLAQGQNIQRFGDGAHAVSSPRFTASSVAATPCACSDFNSGTSSAVSAVLPARSPNTGA